MAIEFHCSHCGHLVRTSGEHAGKRGKCPHCHNSVYIPTPSEEIEPLTLAPLDEREIAERKRADDESRQVARTIMSDKAELPPDSAAVSKAEEEELAPLGDARLAPDMETVITDYVLAMVEGDLDEAERLAVEIRMHMKTADPIIDQLINDELPPRRLTKVPHGVLIGMLKQLRAKK